MTDREFFLDAFSIQNNLEVHKYDMKLAPANQEALHNGKCSLTELFEEIEQSAVHHALVPAINDMPVSLPRKKKEHYYLSIMELGRKLYCVSYEQYGNDVYLKWGEDPDQAFKFASAKEAWWHWYHNKETQYDGRKANVTKEG